MKTYRLIIVLLIHMGIPAYLSYLAYKASGISYNSSGTIDVVWNVMIASFTFIAAYIMIRILNIDISKDYLLE